MKTSYRPNKYIHYILTLIVLGTFTACVKSQEQATTSEKDQSKNLKQHINKAESTINDANIKWLKDYDSQVDNIGENYIPTAVKISKNGDFLEGNEAIASRLKEEKSQFNSIQNRSTEFLTSAGKDQYAYEIASYTTEREQKFMEIVVWNMAEKKRELELTVQVEEGAKANEEIDKARNRWMELCNAHDAEKLVHEMYAENALYYNHKPILQGRPSITKDYSYMNRPEYTLKLAPLANYFVTNMLVFEIGQCSGSYGGKYLIVWQRNDSGKWEVLLDSNV